MKRIAIIGGGISGLSAAFALQQQKNRGAQVEYVLFESSARFGGVIQTEQVDGCVVEAGPDSFLTEKLWAADLCRELGVADHLIGSRDAERKTYILVKGRLVPLPDGLMFMVPTKLLAVFPSPLFSWRTKLRMVREWFYRPGRNSSESTVAEFVERHYGREMVDRIADPLLAGVYGGSADELSIESVLPRFLEMEMTHGSLGRALAAMRRDRAGQVSTRPLFTSLQNGMQQMIDALLVRIPGTAQRLNTRIEAARPEFGKWLVVSGGRRTEEFDAIVMATPAYVAAELLSSASAELASELNAIRYSSSVTVILGYDQETRAALPAGFGFLVPRTENRRILAATFVHNKFPDRAPEDRSLIRCFLAGTRDEGIVENSEDEIQVIVRRELEQILGIRAEPLFVRIYKWKQAMAQYSVGHNKRVERVWKHLAAMPGLALAGNAYRGIGVPDCVRVGSEAVNKVLADLAIDRQATQAAS
jgi:oxygen-dependent protoporphyrinogen oxidase